MARMLTARGAQGCEDLGRDARGAGHAIAHHGKDRQIRVDVDTLHLAVLELALEGAAHDRGGALGLLLRDAQQMECSELPGRSG